MHNMSPNPLTRHLRQPKIYIRLPSGGEYYGSALNRTENGEYPVLAMTARDEITYRTPDALLNGQATVDVIQSCMPNILDAWQIPSIDTDVILTAIRIASIGETMDIEVQVPGLEGETRTFAMDLKKVIDDMYTQTYDNTVVVDQFTVETVPTNYRYFTEMSTQAFEEQRIFRLLKDEKISESDRLKHIQTSFRKLTDMNLMLVKNSIASVTYSGEPAVTDRDHINEFIDQIDHHGFKKIMDHIEKQKQKFSIRPAEIALPAEDVDRGAPKTLTIPLSLDQSNFFGPGSRTGQ